MILTGLLSHISSSLLWQAFHSDRCVSCSDFGDYLFLPTCERACRLCLERNSALWVTYTCIAKHVFHIGDEDLKSCTIINNSVNSSYSWVSVRQAKKAAVQVHGSAEKVAGEYKKYGTSASYSLYSTICKHLKVNTLSMPLFYNTKRNMLTYV